MTLKEFCDTLGIEYDSILDKNIKGLNTLEDADIDEISFLQNNKYQEDLQKTKAAAVFVKEELKHLVPKDTIALVCEEPYVSLAYASKLFTSAVIAKEGKEPSIGDNTIIQENVFLGKNVQIGTNCTIMHGSFIGDNVKVGDNSIIYPNVTVYKECIIGNGTIIHAGTVIGSDGFGFATDSKGQHIKIYQNGNVVIGNNVEIGANSTIDRAVFKSTILEDMVRIDNLVHIGHNCILHKGVILAGQVGLSGSTTLRKYVMMGGQSATAGHIDIAPFSIISARGGVTKSITEPKKQWGGFPLMDQRKWLKLQAKLQKLCFPKNK